MKKAWKITAEIAKWTALGLLGLFAFYRVWNFVDLKNGGKHPLFGRRETVIISGSMSFVSDYNKERLEGITNQIQIDDVVVTTNRFTYDSLEVHDIVLYSDGKRDICHRIASKYETTDGKKMLITIGDANDVPDGSIEYSAIIGKVTKIIPKYGKVLSFFNSPYFLLGVSLSIGFVTVGYIIATREKKPKQIKEKQKSK